MELIIEEIEYEEVDKNRIRKRADFAKKNRCRNIICVLEAPKSLENVSTVIRNVCALGAAKLYVVDKYKVLPVEWSKMRTHNGLMSVSASAIKWTYVRKFLTTADCLSYLGKKKFISMVTSPHIKGKINYDIRDFALNRDHPDYRNKLAVWFGNEIEGVSEEAIQGSEACLQIKMCGIIESLNLAVSTGIILHEICSQSRDLFLDQV